MGGQPGVGSGRTRTATTSTAQHARRPTRRRPASRQPERHATTASRSDPRGSAPVPSRGPRSAAPPPRSATARSSQAHHPPASVRAPAGQRHREQRHEAAAPVRARSPGRQRRDQQVGQPTATRLTCPEIAATSGVHASWAASGTAIASASQRGSQRPRASRSPAPAAGSRPWPAPTARSPTDTASHGSTSSSPSTATPSARGPRVAPVDAEADQRDRAHHGRPQHARLGAREQHEADDPHAGTTTAGPATPGRPRAGPAANADDQGEVGAETPRAGGSARWCGSPRRGLAWQGGVVSRRRGPAPVPAAPRRRVQPTCRSQPAHRAAPPTSGLAATHYLGPRRGRGRAQPSPSPSAGARRPPTRTVAPERAATPPAPVITSTGWCNARSTSRLPPGSRPRGPRTSRRTATPCGSGRLGARAAPGRR